jgi:hypothetical protein
MPRFTISQRKLSETIGSLRKFGRGVPLADVRECVMTVRCWIWKVDAKFFEAHVQPIRIKVDQIINPRFCGGTAQLSKNKKAFHLTPLGIRLKPGLRHVFHWSKKIPNAAHNNDFQMCIVSSKLLIKPSFPPQDS